MSSRTETHIVRQKQLHKLRHIIRELAGRLPKEHRSEATIKDLLSYGCLTRIHVMLLQAPHIEEEAEAKDLDFTDEAIEARWRAGREQTLRLIERAPWLDECDPLEGVILHRVEDAEHVATS